MKKQHGSLLDFLLSSHQQLTEIKQRELSLLALRSQLEESEPAHAGTEIFLGDLLPLPAPPTPLPTIPEYVFDDTFGALLQRRKAEDVVVGSLDPRITRPPIAFFLPPEAQIADTFAITKESESQTSSWASKVANVRTQFSAYSIRTGFLSHEYDIYESIALGFQAITVHARAMDFYQIQLCAEICRDFRKSLIVVVDSLASLERALKTDAPYIAFWCYEPQEFRGDISLCAKLASQVPSNCIKLAFLRSAKSPELNALTNLGFRGVFV